MPNCRSCDAEIFYRQHIISGVSAPLNIGPDPQGNLRLEGDKHYAVVPAAERAGFVASGGTLYMPHYKSCPQAPTWRTGRKKKARK